MRAAGHGSPAVLARNESASHWDMSIFWRYEAAIIGTIAAIVIGWILHRVGDKLIQHSAGDAPEHYRKRQFLNTALTVAVVVCVIVLWGRHFQAKGTFFGLVAAGLTVALKEPLLSIAGRIAVFAGHMYAVGDRIEVNKLSGDVIDIGFFYTRMMEIGNWIGGDQYTGRIIQFANAEIFGHPVFNYTRNFAYIWDEVELPITYDSNSAVASQILLDVGSEYTKEFLEGAQASVEQMQRYFLVSNFELKPQVYMKVDSNYVHLTMRYLVEPKKRRNAQTFIYTEVFKRIQGRKDIQIGSDTMSVTVQAAKGQELPAELTPKGGEQAA